MYSYYLKENNKIYILTFATLEKAKEQQKKDISDHKEISPIYKSNLKMN